MSALTLSTWMGFKGKTSWNSQTLCCKILENNTIRWRHCQRAFILLVTSQGFFSSVSNNHHWGVSTVNTNRVRLYFAYTRKIINSECNKYAEILNNLWYLKTYKPIWTMLELWWQNVHANSCSSLLENTYMKKWSPFVSGYLILRG